MRRRPPYLWWCAFDRSLTDWEVAQPTELCVNKKLRNNGLDECRTCKIKKYKLVEVRRGKR